MGDIADGPPPELTDLVKATGQMFMVGFPGHEITPQIRQLIAEYHVGSVILSAKNLKDAPSTRNLIKKLQQIAHDSGHEHPLLVGIDQENGMLNNLYDPKFITQFPGAMGMAATKSVSMAKEVANASGRELKSVGFNWVFGPVLDVLTNSNNPLLGVRTMGDDVKEVGKYGVSMIDGYRSAGLVSCGKHFPGYGNATVDSILGLPIVPESIEQLKSASLIPFQKAVKHGIDAIMVGGCALPKIAVNEMHACLSERVVNELLREEMGYDGVILSECLEMDALYENVGVRQGTVMAVSAGCDMVLVCSSNRLQKEAISGVFGAVQGGILDEEIIFRAAKRIATLKKRRLSWKEALNPQPLSSLEKLKAQHQSLSDAAYEHSLTLLRDHGKYIPLTKSMEPDADITLLTPLVAPIITTQYDSSMNHLLMGETVFHQLGKAISRHFNGKILHTSYTANGLTSMHDNLIERCQAVIVVTTDANRNMYQVGFTKHINMICAQQRKPLIVVAASSPYDLALDRSIGTYLCLYEFTGEAMETAAKILCGLLPSKGSFPGTGLYQQSLGKQDRVKNKYKNGKKKWLVEFWQPERDLKRLRVLMEHSFPDRKHGTNFSVFQILRNGSSSNILNSRDQVHFVVRNSSTNQLYGFCATWVYEEEDVGCICIICVDPSRRGMSIGTSLHDRAMKYLVQERGVRTVRIGTTFPSFFQGIPVGPHMATPFFQQVGWDFNINDVRNLVKRVSLSGGFDAPNEVGSRISDLSPEGIKPSVKTLGDVDELDPSDNLPLTRRLAQFGERENTDLNDENFCMTEALSILMLHPLQEWFPPKKLISELEMVGIKFDICLTEDRMCELRELLGRAAGHVDGLRALYDAAFPGEDAKIIIAQDPVKNTILGSVILFTRASNIACCMPWIFEFGNARVGGLCGLVTDPQFQDLTGVFTLGLIGCGVRQFKLQGFERCLIDGATDYQVNICVNNDLKLWRRYIRISNSANFFAS